MPFGRHSSEHTPPAADSSHDRFARSLTREEERQLRKRQFIRAYYEVCAADDAADSALEKSFTAASPRAQDAAVRLAANQMVRCLEAREDMNLSAEALAGFRREQAE